MAKNKGKNYVDLVGDFAEKKRDEKAQAKENAPILQKGIESSIASLEGEQKKVEVRKSRAVKALNKAKAVITDDIDVWTEGVRSAEKDLESCEKELESLSKTIERYRGYEELFNV